MADKVFEEVPVDQLRWRCDPDTLPFVTTEAIPACDEIIGQERALEAIRVGLDINSIGYNILILGIRICLTCSAFPQGRESLSRKRWRH